VFFGLLAWVSPEPVSRAVIVQKEVRTGQAER
jgi:hypothetical protein